MYIDNRHAPEQWTCTRTCTQTYTLKCVVHDQFHVQCTIVNGHEGIYYMYMNMFTIHSRPCKICTWTYPWTCALTQTCTIVHKQNHDIKMCTNIHIFMYTNMYICEHVHVR